MSIRVALNMAIVLAAAGACSAPPLPKGHYKVPFKEALARLEKADIQGFRKLRQCGLLIHFYSSHPDNHSIRWDVTSDDIDVVNFTVSLSPLEDGTKATIIVATDANGHEMYDSKASYPHPGLRQPLRPALVELVDAAIENRHFEFERIVGDLSVDGVCNSEFNRLASGNATFRITDPQYMSHEDVLKGRSRE
jgi:hypothetical protein